jgi:Ca-activated chloride channel family protein
MNDIRLLPDDPRLTAYALGELAGDERAAVEAALRENPALQVAVDEIRTTAAILQSALGHEPIFKAPPVNAAQAGIVIDLNGRSAEAATANRSARKKGKMNSRSTPVAKDPEYPVPNPRTNILRFPQFYYVVGTTAAACFAVMVALREPPPPAQPAPNSTERIVTREIALTPPVAETPESPADSAVEPSALSPSTLAAANPVEGTSAIAPTFANGDLSLIKQTKPELDASMPGSAGRMFTFRPGPLLGVPPNRIRNPNYFETPPPPVMGPVIAASTTSSLVPNPTVVSSSDGSVTSSASGDVVVLSTFMVTADRLVGFAGISGTRPTASDKRKIARRDDLPLAPPGERLVRNVEATSYVKDNDFVTVRQSPESNFAVDVNTASYANVRRILQHGTPPPREAVRIEEMVNYFPYRYAAPHDDQPFAAALEVAEAPWAPKHRLVRIGIKAREVPEAQRPPANLVFLLDVSASMNEASKLPLVQESLRLLVGKLKPDDRVAIVTYGGNSGLALPSTPASQPRDILNALDALTPARSPLGGATGIQLAYDVARASFVRDGINRVILCTDGDFDLGTNSEADLVRLIEEKAGADVYLSVLGFGMGHYKDATLEKLASRGQGAYGYIDTKREAEKMLVEQVSGALVTVAKDVKVEVVFNPAAVSSYRLIGYENRLLRKEDFNDENADAGEVGAGHTITALYEIVPVGVESGSVEGLAADLRESASVRREANGRRDALNNELLTVKVRYKKPTGRLNFAQTIEFPLANAATAFVRASADFRFAAAVAQFGMILRGSPHRGVGTMADVAAWAATAASPADDPGGYRSEFLDLVRKAQTMME